MSPLSDKAEGEAEGLLLLAENPPPPPLAEATGLEMTTGDVGGGVGVGVEGLVGVGVGVTGGVGDGADEPAETTACMT